MCRKISAGVDGGLSGGSSVRRPLSEDANSVYIVVQLKMFFTQAVILRGAQIWLFCNLFTVQSQCEKFVRIAWLEVFHRHWVHSFCNYLLVHNTNSVSAVNANRLII